MSRVQPVLTAVLREEINSLLTKCAIRMVPQADAQSGFYSCYFVVPKRDGGLLPLDLQYVS